MSGVVRANLVSTIIPVHNRPGAVADAVVSVLAQSYRPIEVIVIDDGSTDDTPDVLGQLATEHPEIRVFTQVNQGAGSARETGRLNARGEFIQYLDSNEVLLPQKFTRQVDVLQQGSDCDVAYGKTRLSALGQSTLRSSNTGAGEAHSAMFPWFLRERGWNTSTPLYRRTVIEQAGPWLDVIEDGEWEYDCRVASLGGRLVYVDEIVSETRLADTPSRADESLDRLMLQHQCLVRARIFHHARRFLRMPLRFSEISDDDWSAYSTSTFRLGLRCALAGLKAEARAMTQLSIDALGKKTPRHRAFLTLVKWLGWQRAARYLQAVSQ